MIYLVIHLQNKISRRLLHWNCVVMHGGHIKRESDLKFTGPINKFHQPPNASAMSAYSCLMSLSPPLSLICVSFTLSLHAIMCIRALREKKYGNRHIPGLETRAEFLQLILSLETELLMSPASQRVHEGDFLLSCQHYILNIYFPACCTFKDCCLISRFNSSCPTWETNEVSLNAIIAAAAICFLQVDVHILWVHFVPDCWCYYLVLGTCQRLLQGVKGYNYSWDLYDLFMFILENVLRCWSLPQMFGKECIFKGVVHLNCTILSLFTSFLSF